MCHVSVCCEAFEYKCHNLCVFGNSDESQDFINTFVQWLNVACCPLTSAASTHSLLRDPFPQTHLSAAALQINDHCFLGQVAKLPLYALILLWGQAGFSREGDGIDKSRTQDDIITWPLSFDSGENRIIAETNLVVSMASLCLVVKDFQSDCAIDR